VCKISGDTALEKNYDDLGQHSQRAFNKSSPKHVRETAVQAVSKFPDKRLFIHFMQPHTPYYGSKAENIRQNYHNDQGIVFTNLMDDDMISEVDEENQYSHLLNAAMNDAGISQSDIYTAYAENLEIVLSQVESFIDELWQDNHNI
jgi:hypothetical protein